MYIVESLLKRFLFVKTTILFADISVICRFPQPYMVTTSPVVEETGEDDGLHQWQSDEVDGYDFNGRTCRRLPP